MKRLRIVVEPVGLGINVFPEPGLTSSEIDEELSPAEMACREFAARDTRHQYEIRTGLCRDNAGRTRWGLSVRGINLGFSTVTALQAVVPREIP